MTVTTVVGGERLGEGVNLGVGVREGLGEDDDGGEAGRLNS